MPLVEKMRLGDPFNRPTVIGIPARNKGDGLAVNIRVDNGYPCAS